MIDTDDSFPEAAPARPIWLITLADLALLLVGFFVLIQASQSENRMAIARALRANFGGEPISEAQPALPLAAASITDFATGSSALPHDPDNIIAWARDISRDRRVMLTVTGGVDGSAADVDPATGSNTVLAADRARTVAAAIALAVPGIRLTVTTVPPTPGTASGQRRAVLVSAGFAGDPNQAAAGGKQGPQ